VSILNYFLQRPQFDAMQKITYFYFPRLIKAVPIIGLGFLQPIFFKVSLHRVLVVELHMHLGFQKTQKKHLRGSDR